MPTDRYTKTVLTIIAVCLVYLSLAVTRWPAALAAADPQEVVIVGWTSSSPSYTIKDMSDGMPVRVVGGR